MSRTVAGRRGDFESKPTGPVRNYPVSRPLSHNEAVERVMELCKIPRWQAIAAVGVAIVHRANSEPAPGGLITIRVVPGGFEIEERTGKG